MGRGSKWTAKNGMSPLDIAAVVHGNAPTVRYLLEHGAEMTPPASTTRRGSYVLTDAAERGDPETIKLLLAHGGDVTVLDGFGETPLMGAAGGDPLSQCEEKMDLLLPGSDVQCAKHVRRQGEERAHFVDSHERANVCRALAGRLWCRSW